MRSICICRVILLRRAVEIKSLVRRTKQPQPPTNLFQIEDKYSKMANNNLTEIADQRQGQRQRILKLCIEKLKEDDRKEKEDKIDVPLLRIFLLTKLFGKLSLDGDGEANSDDSDDLGEFQNCDSKSTEESRKISKSTDESWSWAEDVEAEAEEKEKREKLRRQILTAKSFLLFQLQK